VEYVDLTDEEEALALATLDPISAMATANKEVLTSLLHDVRVSSAGLQGLLADLAQKNGIALSHLQGQVPEDPLPELDRAAELQEKWQTALGQLWIIPSQTVATRQVALCPHCNHPNGVK
jgi:hypothetical protein